MRWWRDCRSPQSLALVGPGRFGFLGQEWADRDVAREELGVSTGRSAVGHSMERAHRKGQGTSATLVCMAPRANRFAAAAAAAIDSQRTVQKTQI